MWFQAFALAFFLLFLYYVYFKLVASKYWKNRNVFQVDPVFLLGNNWEGLFFDNISFILERRYRKWKDKKLVGFWTFTTPSLLVTDLELIRRILIRDFNHFMDRNINVNEDIDPLAGHLVNLSGSKWRNLRVKLTPTFTSGKMKMMFPTMVECGLDLQDFLSEFAERQETLEMREILARFTTDIISSCAFGIETKCLRHPDSEFRNYGKKIFQPGLYLLLRFLLNSFFPSIKDLLRIRTIPKDVSDFFIKVVQETMDYRQKNRVKRNDFMELLIQLRNKGKLDDVDAENGDSTVQGQKFSLNQAAAQAFVFFVAGFETSSTTLSFAFYELAVNPDVQSKLQNEIDESLNKTDGKMTYEGIVEMEYLDWVIQETLRKYPPLTILGRKCTKEYEIPEMGVKLEQGSRILISIIGIQRDPEYFPDPDKFDPNRFSPKEKAKRDRLTSLPFGEGPRSCIGDYKTNFKCHEHLCEFLCCDTFEPTHRVLLVLILGNRFGLLQTKVGLVTVLSKYNVEVAKETPIPLMFDKRAFILTPVGGVPLKITCRR